MTRDDASGRAARRTRPGRRGVVNKPAPAPDPAPRGSKSDRVGSGRVGSARIRSGPVRPSYLSVSAVESRADTCGPHPPTPVRYPTTRNHGGAPPRSARTRSLVCSLARSLGALAATRRRQKPGSAASVSRCRADHDDALGTHVGRLHDHDTPSVIGITAASSAHVHCVPWKFERAPSAMFGETLAGLLRGSNAPPRDDTAKRVGT